MSAGAFDAKCDATVRRRGVLDRTKVSVYDVPTVLFDTLPGHIYALSDGVRAKSVDVEGLDLTFFEAAASRAEVTP